MEITGEKSGGEEIYQNVAMIEDTNRLIDINIVNKYMELRNTPSDISHYLSTLCNLAKECESVFETGVRGVVSSWAFALGLCSGSANRPRMLMNDIEVCDIREFAAACANSHLTLNARWCNNLKLEFEEDETQDLTFIDTLHVYGQLKRELSKFAPLTNKQIVMHDTVVDGEVGEIHRLYEDPETTAEEFSNELNIPKDELLKGLKQAVNEFLDENPEWVISEHHPSWPGLTILKRVENPDT